ncbi:hypothetical protein DIPPA_12023 [Diplonema papillatum]|nr:hypothetical protein DIPPA_12023 [Diplonema papillatum]
MKEEVLHVASVASAALFSFALSSFWFSLCYSKPDADEDASSEAGNPTPKLASHSSHHGAEPDKTVITIACSVMESACLYHLSQIVPGKHEGPGKAWLEVSVLSSILLTSSRLMQFSTPHSSPSSVSLHHVGYDVVRICGAIAVMLGVEHGLQAAEA